jgi:hypothetical protein
MELHARILSALIALTAAAVPAGAFAQAEAPVPAPAPPSYAVPAPPPAPGDEAIHGRVASFDGGYNLRVNDDRGYIDNVRLRQGTIINPTGLTLAPGMIVTIRGVNTGSTFTANQIDTPYQTYGAAYAYPVYPYAVYGYPYYGYPWGPRISVGFGFGFTPYRGGFPYRGGYYRR